jgi:hypothetical protein
MVSIVTRLWAGRLVGFLAGARDFSHSAEVKNEWSYTSTAPYIFMVWCLIIT